MSSTSSRNGYNGYSDYRFPPRNMYPPRYYETLQEQQLRLRKNRLHKSIKEQISKTLQLLYEQEKEILNGAFEGLNIFATCCRQFRWVARSWCWKPSSQTRMYYNRWLGARE